MKRNLGKKLWAIIEQPQGDAYISDDVEEMDDRKVMSIAKVALTIHLECVKELRKFIEGNREAESHHGR